MSRVGRTSGRRNTGQRQEPEAIASERRTVKGRTRNRTEPDTGDLFMDPELHLYKPTNKQFHWVLVLQEAQGLAVAGMGG